MAKKSESEVAAKAKTEMALFDPLQDAGMGMEGATKESFAVPFIKVLQKLSPQLEKTNSAFIKGAEEGEFLETISNERFESVQIVQCAYRRVFLRWGPRGSDNGGFKGEVMPEDAAAMLSAGELVEHEGRMFYPMEDGSVNPKRCDFLSDTRNHYCLLLTEQGPKECLLSLSSTQIKKSKQIMTMLAGEKAKDANGMTVMLPTFASIIGLKSAMESNDKGNWYGIVPSMAGKVADRAIYDQAKAFHKTVVAGDVKVDYNAAVDEDQQTAKDKF